MSHADDHHRIIIELIDIVELSPFTLADRRIYNLLIANAWERIGELIIHRIPKTA